MNKRIVVKVGTNVLTCRDGKLDITRMSSIVDQIVWLRRKGFDVILVSSGAVAAGRSELSSPHGLNDVEQRQLFSALGQVKITGLYYDLFREYGIHIGQVLTTKNNFETPELYQNQKACMSVMVDNGVLPIVNENDTVSLTELMFTDNDELSGLIAHMMNADTLVLLTNVDGLMDIKPSGEQHLIECVRAGDDVSRFVQAKKSYDGRGGMASKVHTAQAAAAQGIRVVIANGNTSNILVNLYDRPLQTPHTEFVPTPSKNE